MPAVSSYLYHIGLFVRTQVRYFFSVSIFFGTNSKKTLHCTQSFLRYNRPKGVVWMAENKFQSPEMLARCLPMSSLQAVLGGKWKILILWYVAFYKVQRFG